MGSREMVTVIAFCIVCVCVSQAQAAEDQELPDLQVCHLLKAECWNDAHNVIMKDLAAPAIINGL